MSHSGGVPEFVKLLHCLRIPSRVLSMSVNNIISRMLGYIRYKALRIRRPRASRPVCFDKTGGGSGPHAHGGAYCSPVVLGWEYGGRFGLPARHVFGRPNIGMSCLAVCHGNRQRCLYNIITDMQSSDTIMPPRTHDPKVDIVFSVPLLHPPLAVEMNAESEAIDHLGSCFSHPFSSLHHVHWINNLQRLDSTFCSHSRRPLAS